MWGLGTPELLIFLFATAVPLGLLLWALIDAIRNPNLSDNERLIWVIVIIFVACIGPILYLIIGRKGTPPKSRTDIQHL